MPSANCVIRIKDFLSVPERRNWVGLDVGCGGHIGELAEYGLDAASVPTFVDSEYPREKFTQGNIYEMPFKDNSFDYVVSAHVLEHLQRPILALEEMARVARYVVIANVPRYTLDIEIATKEPCVSLDHYYFANHPDMMKKYGLTREDFPIWSPGATKFNEFDAPHCAWYPYPSDLKTLLEDTKLFEYAEAEECPSNCGESMVYGWLK